MKRQPMVFVVACLACAAAACGKEAIPTERLGRAEGAVRSARATGAEGEPSAALHLKLANENLARAKRLIDEGDNNRASYLLMRAEADADLARTLNDEAKAKAAEQRAMMDLESARGSGANPGNGTEGR